MEFYLYALLYYSSVSSASAIVTAFGVAKVNDNAAGYDLRILHAEGAPVARSVLRQVSETAMRAVFQQQ